MRTHYIFFSQRRHLLGSFFKSRIFFLGKGGGPFIGSDSGVLFDSGPFLFSLTVPLLRMNCVLFRKQFISHSIFCKKCYFREGAKFARGEKRTSQDPTLFPSLYLPSLSRTPSRPLDSPHKFWILSVLTWQKTFFPLCSLQKKIDCVKDTAVFLLKKIFMKGSFAQFLKNVFGAIISSKCAFINSFFPPCGKPQSAPLISLN